MKTAVLIVSLLLFTTIAKAQIDWQHCYGGTGYEECNAIRATFDSGYILAGYTSSNDGDIIGNHGGGDFWVVKISANGAIEWQKCYGGSNDELAYDIRQTVDSGYVVAGRTNSNDGDVTGNHGGGDVWVVKISSTGVLQWEKCIGGSGGDLGFSVGQTNDGGYIIAGETNSNDGDVSGNHGESDVWVVKLSDTGSIEWAKCYGESNEDAATSIQQTMDGGYIVGGNSYSNDGDVSGHHGDTSTADFWMVKLAATGSIEWQKSLGSTTQDWEGTTIQTKDSGYISVGNTSLENGDVSNLVGGPDVTDGWIIKLSGTGVKQWDKCIYINGFGKLFETGNIDWVGNYGGSFWDEFYSVAPVNEGTGIAAGYAISNNGDVSGNHGNKDYWVVKFGWHTNVPIIGGYGLTLVPNPADHYLSITAKNEITSITIPNIMGQLVYTYVTSGQNATPNSGKLKVDVHDWPAGLYFAKINGIVATKFVKD